MQKRGFDAFMQLLSTLPATQTKVWELNLFHLICDISKLNRGNVLIWPTFAFSSNFKWYWDRKDWNYQCQRRTWNLKEFCSHLTLDHQLLISDVYLPEQGCSQLASTDGTFLWIFDPARLRKLKAGPVNFSAI